MQLLNVCSYIPNIRRAQLEGGQFLQRVLLRKKWDEMCADDELLDELLNADGILWMLRSEICTDYVHEDL